VSYHVRGFILCSFVLFKFCFTLLSFMFYCLHCIGLLSVLFYVSSFVFVNVEFPFVPPFTLLSVLFVFYLVFMFVFIVCFMVCFSVYVCL